MSIKSRPVVAPAPRNPNRAPARKPPTQSQLSLAAYRLADELGGRDIPQADSNAAAENIYNFATESVATAWSLMKAADIAVRAYSGRKKISGGTYEDVVGPYLEEVDKAKAEDHKSRGALIEEIKAADKNRRIGIKAELRDLMLRGISQGEPMELGPAASAFLLNAMLREFQPVKGSPMAVEDFPRFVKGNVRFLDWLGTTLLFTQEQVAEYQAAKEADKAARARAAGSPAPDASATESDKDNSGAGEEDGSPAEEPDAQSA